MLDDRQLTVSFPSPRHSSSAWSRCSHIKANTFPRFNVQTHLQQISTDAISVHFIRHSLKISFSFQQWNPRERSTKAFQPLFRSGKKRNEKENRKKICLLSFGLRQKTGLCFLVECKKQFCGIIVAFQSAKETGFKPIISHMESARGLAGCCWMGAKSSRR